MTPKNQARVLGAIALGVLTFFAPDIAAAGLVVAVFMGAAT